MFTLKNIGAMVLVLFASFLLINLTDGSVPSPLESSSGCCSIVDVSETGASDIADPPDIKAEGDSSSQFFQAATAILIATIIWNEIWN